METYVLYYERKHLESSQFKDPKRTDIRSIQYNYALLNYRFIYASLKYFLPFMTIFLFKPLSKFFNTNLKFGIYAFFIIRVIPQLFSEYYRIFHTETIFKFNVYSKREFFIDFTIVCSVDAIILAILVHISTLFTDITNGRKGNGKFFSESVNEEVDVNYDLSGPENLADVNLASEGAVIQNSDCSGDKLHMPLTLLIALIALHILRSGFSDQYNPNYRNVVAEPFHPFNESIHYLSANNVDLFKKRVRYSFSKSTLHSEIKLSGLIHPKVIFSVNNFFYIQTLESLYLGPIIHSLVESYDKIILFLVDISRYIAFCIILFGVLRLGFEEFIYRSTPVHTVVLFISFCIFITIDSFFCIFSNAIARILTLSHDCAAVTMGFQIMATLQKLYTADAKVFSPSIPFKLLFMNEPTLADHVAHIATCV